MADGFEAAVGGVIGMVPSSATESASRSTAVAAASELARRSEHRRAEVGRFLATVRAA